VNKLMTRLEKLTEFQTRGANIAMRVKTLQTEGQSLDMEFNNWLKTELGLDGQHHVSEILKVALETSVEPTPKIIT
jgi:hypothetical protein